MKPGDEVTSDSGVTYRIGPLLAVQGQEGCEDIRCTRRNGECIGYHCPTCGAPCSMMGHKQCQDGAA